MTSGPRYSSAAIEEAWEKEAEQRWAGQALGLPIVQRLAVTEALLEQRHLNFSETRARAADASSAARPRGMALWSPSSARTAFHYPNKDTPALPGNKPSVTAEHSDTATRGDRRSGLCATRRPLDRHCAAPFGVVRRETSVLLLSG